MNLRLTLLLTGAVLVSASALTGAESRFDFDDVRERAKAAASKPYVAPASRVPEWLLRLSYDEHRRIRFDESHSWWRTEELPFQLQFFHPGFVQSGTVQVSEVVDGKPKLITFDRDLFIYDRLKPGELPPTMGFAGFRMLYPMQKANDELGAFQGASYFRLLCKNTIYGLSARGLALNTAEEGPEEFPIFTEFWIEKASQSTRCSIARACPVLTDSSSRPERKR
jgi:glucans biosynthesis protein